MYSTSWKEKGFVRDEDDDVRDRYLKLLNRLFIGYISKLADGNCLYYSNGKSVINGKGEKLAKN